MHPLHVGLFSYISAFRSWIMAILLASTDGILPGVVMIHRIGYEITFILSACIIKWNKMYTIHVYRATYSAVALLCVGDLWEQASGLATFEEIVISSIFNGSFIFSHYNICNMLLSRHVGEKEYSVINLYGITHIPIHIHFTFPQLFPLSCPLTVALYCSI